jgi:hypothetical protein
MATQGRGKPRGVERRAARAVRQQVKKAKVSRNPTPRVEQFPSAFPNAPESAAGIGRTLSRGLADG